MTTDPFINLTWKARFIVTQDGHVDLPHDRQSVEGEPDATTREGARTRVKFLNELSDVFPSELLFKTIRSKLLSREIHTREAADVVLLDATQDGRHWRISGNSNASAGYFYVTAAVLND